MHFHGDLYLYREFFFIKNSLHNFPLISVPDRCVQCYAFIVSKDIRGNNTNEGHAKYRLGCVTL